MQDSSDVAGLLAFIDAADGVRLAARLHLPPGNGPFATLLEALPYRMDDVTSSYADSYHRFVDEGGFAVLRLDLRGTGSSGGFATDEYPDIERSDLSTVMEWIAAQSWSSGRVGMFGTSYSGFNSLHMAMENVPQLGAVAAMYATDDRYTDDVHYMGGVLRALDLIDYPLYMVAMNALPPVPSVWAQGHDTPWRDEWMRRLAQHEPWLLTWLRHPLPDPIWRRGSVRTAPRTGYERYTCPVLLISGWADGYRNNTFRAIEQMADWYLLAGPWAHKDPAVARPGPNIDADLEIIRFFDQHLRGGAPVGERGRVFLRRWTSPEPDLVLHAGEWLRVDQWPPANAVSLVLRPPSDGHVDRVVALGDVGLAAWNSCAGSLPWGQPLDQRVDNARSLTYDFEFAEPTVLAGNADVCLRVASTAPVGHVSVKLCDVAPDGTSALIARGMLDLTHRGLWPSDGTGRPGTSTADVVPGEWMDVTIGVEATTWVIEPGHRLRLAIAGTDWPNCWPPAQPFELHVSRDHVALELPVVDGLPVMHGGFEPGPGPSAYDPSDIGWRYEHDPLTRETRVHTRYGGPYEGHHGTSIVDVYEGELGISTADLSSGWARGRARYDMTFPDAGTCTTQATLFVRSDREAFEVEIGLTAWFDGEVVGERTWSERFDR